MVTMEAERQRAARELGVPAPLTPVSRNFIVINVTLAEWFGIPKVCKVRSSEENLRSRLSE
jgi:hypothetical protein